jgi:hypothetical protein
MFMRMKRDEEAEVSYGIQIVSQENDLERKRFEQSTATESISSGDLIHGWEVLI